MNASWQHCKGSSPEFRGYTCGLWTTFHAITVHAYMNTIAQPMDPLKPLLSIKGWVSSYFGCLHCRRHFIHMTTNLFPMNSQRVNLIYSLFLFIIFIILFIIIFYLQKKKSYKTNKKFYYYFIILNFIINFIMFYIINVIFIINFILLCFILFH